MSGAHAHAVEPGAQLDGPIERMAPEAKVAGALTFIVTAVATPAVAYRAWAVQALIAVALAVAAAVPARVLARRAVFELPFVALAAALAVAGTGPRVHIAGAAVSEPGLHAGWVLVSRATLGVVVASVLAATTTPAQVVVGLRRLRVPALVCELAATTVRYLAVLRDELDRMRLAQQLRSPDGRVRAREVAGVGSALLVRAFERGERVHLARAARAPGGARAAVILDAAPRAGAVTWLAALAPSAGAAIAAAGLA